MNLFKKEYNKDDTSLEQLINIAMPFRDEYMYDMIFSDQKARYEGINKKNSEHLDNKSALIYIGAMAAKYFVEGTILFTTVQTLLR